MRDPALPAALTALALLAACAPIPLDQAEATCARRIQTDGVPRGGVTLGAGTGYGTGFALGTGVGIAAGTDGVSVGVATTLPLGPEPDLDTAFARCVRQKSGSDPVRPLSAFLTPPAAG
jgi:hypothetical protein